MMYSNLTFPLPEEAFHIRQHFMCMGRPGKHPCGTEHVNFRPFQMTGNVMLTDLRCSYPVRPNPIRPPFLMFNKQEHRYLEHTAFPETGCGNVYGQQNVTSLSDLNDINNCGKPSRFQTDVDIVSGAPPGEPLSPTNMATTNMDSSDSCGSSTDMKKAFSCPQCKYTTDRKNNLKRHIITMHFDCDRKLECCGANFRSKAKLREHVILFHKDGYRCLTCSRIFCRKALLRRHMAVHSGKKDFVCSLCDYATSHKSNLERHQKVHLKSKGAQNCGLNMTYTHRKYVRRNFNNMAARSAISYRPYISPHIKDRRVNTLDERSMQNPTTTIQNVITTDRSKRIIWESVQEDTLSNELTPPDETEKDSSEYLNGLDSKTEKHVQGKTSHVQHCTSYDEEESQTHIGAYRFTAGLGKQVGYGLDENFNHIEEGAISLTKYDDKPSTADSSNGLAKQIEINQKSINDTTEETVTPYKRLENECSLLNESSLIINFKRRIFDDEKEDGNLTNDKEELQSELLKETHVLYPDIVKRSEMSIRRKQIVDKENIQEMVRHSPITYTDADDELRDVKRLCVMPYRCASCRQRFKTQTQFLRHGCDVIEENIEQDRVSAFSLVAKIIKMGHV